MSSTPPAKSSIHLDEMADKDTAGESCTKDSKEDLDGALGVLQAYTGESAITPAEECRLVRKLDLALMPIVSSRICSFCQC